MYPGVVFGAFFLLNLIVWGAGSSGAVPFSTMLAILVLWFGVSVPLVLLGAYMGFRKQGISLPNRVNKVQRPVPRQPWHRRPVFTALVCGVLPFGAALPELSSVMSSLWLQRFYHLFGFLALVLAILCVTCAEVAVAATYFQLSAEDHRWWWTSFLASGSSGIYVFLYSVWYFSARLDINTVDSAILYFGYMGVISILFMLLTGAIGCLSSFWFTRHIYSFVVID